MITVQNTPCISRRRLVQCCLALFAFGGLARKAQANVVSGIEHAYVGGLNYQYYAECINGGSYAKGSASVGTTGGGAVPAGYMGVLPGLWDVNSNLVLAGSWTYTNTRTSLHTVATSSYPYSGTYYGKGAIHIFNGGGYSLFYTNVTPYVQLGLAGTEVCVNSRGETYGSGYFNDGLDLIRAIGVNGVEGYVRSSDLYGSSPATPEEAIARNDAGAFTIPVYDAEGVQVIDSFAVCEGVALSG